MRKTLKNDGLIFERAGTNIILLLIHTVKYKSLKKLFVKLDYWLNLLFLMLLTYYIFIYF